MKGLCVAVVSCSGTGGPIVDQRARLGVGELVLVNPDLVQVENLNRITNTTMADVGRPRVEVLSNFVSRLGLRSRATPSQQTTLANPRAGESFRRS